MAGEGAEWGITDHLLANVVDVLAIANWQRGGGKGSRPPRVPRPGTKDQTKYGRSSRSPAEAVAYLAQFAPKGG
jgi:hypothetical protein